MAARTPEECEMLWERHLNAGDVDGLLALYESCASHVRSDGTTPNGVEEIREVLEEFIAMRPKFKVSLKKSVRAGGDLAVLYDEWTLTAIAPDGSPLAMGGKGVHVVRRQQDGSWAFAVTGVTNAPW